MNKQAQKESIRKILLSRRSGIPEDEYLAESKKITERVLQLPELRNARTIHCYVSMNERREVNTHPLLKNLLESGSKVAVPVTLIESGTLYHAHLEGFDDLEPNKWGVLEPTGDKRISEQDLDLVIVPMVGGDIHKNRIGYGMGFYDRFLQNVSCPTVGLLFECCLVDKIPVEPFDVKLDTLVTEKREII